MAAKIKLNKWDPANTFNNPDKAFTMVISATRNSGKSNLLKHLYLNIWHPNNYFDSVCVFSKTMCEGFYENFIPGNLMFDRFSMVTLRKCMNTAKYYKSRGRTWRLLVIMDDCISRKDKFVDELDQIFTNGRHYNVSLVYITQKLSYCSTTWYNNLNCIILLRNTSRGEKRYIAEKILNDIISDSFPNDSENALTRRTIAMQSAICKNYHAIIALPLVDSENYENKLFIYRAPNMGN